MAVLDDTAIEAALEGLKGWTREGDEIRRTFEFDSFQPAIDFVNRVAEAAEAANHHPDIDIRFSRVTLTLSTHSAGGLTKRDFALASRIDEMAG
jgi:4a-hydroxytetrahydrobiopterin dehydratase